MPSLFLFDLLKKACPTQTCEKLPDYLVGLVKREATPKRRERVEPPNVTAKPAPGRQVRAAPVIATQPGTRHDRTGVLRSSSVVERPHADEVETRSTVE